MKNVLFIFHHLFAPQAGFARVKRHVIRGVVRFANGINITLRTHGINNYEESRYERARNFIENGLRKNCPIILLVTFNSYVADLPQGSMSEKHFATITGIRRNWQVERRYMHGRAVAENTVEGSEDCELVISDIGERRIIPSLRKLWDARMVTIVSLIRSRAGSITGLYLGMRDVMEFASVSLAYCELVAPLPARNFVPSRLFVE